MKPVLASPVVHLELRTGKLSCACAFDTRLFGWLAETVRTGSGTSMGLVLGTGIEGESCRAARSPVPAVHPENWTPSACSIASSRVGGQTSNSTICSASGSPLAR